MRRCVLKEVLAARSFDSLSERPSEWVTAISSERSNEDTIVDVDSSRAFLFSSELNCLFVIRGKVQLTVSALVFS